ncbi:hypothetical protein RAS2_07190 [Phycisphaerae bacterium RAS2]|nr:hypothetical protein RAS2_07190 [Phycisphaerae bacterium RAS2]
MAIPRIIHFVSILLTAIVTNGCAHGGNTASINRVLMSDDGKSLVFSTYMDKKVWAVAASEFVECGREPFAMSPSGQTVIALKGEGQLAVNIIQRENGGFGLVHDLTPKCLISEPSCHLVSFRCNDEVAVIQVSCLNGNSGVHSQRWMRMEFDSGATQFVERDAWDQLRDAVPIRGDKSSTEREVVTLFESRAGIKLAQRTDSDSRNCIMATFADGHTQLLLREDAGSFWMRRIAECGLQYP